ncbi:MAG: response regulator [Mariprofundales bacterium]|nr:response regulator [Mariprofundales bacterium]
MQKRILIVDDEQAVCQVLKLGLERMGRGYQVVTTDNGHKALQIIREQSFDLIVTDYKMAGMDGLALLEAIRRIRPQARVVLMTAYGTSEVEAQARKLQAYRYLAKPLELQDFRQVVSQALDDMVVNREGVLMLPDTRYMQIGRLLARLQREVGAHCVLLVDVQGQVIAQQGKTESLPVSEMVALLGGGIATLSEAGQALDGKVDALNLIYRESECYHLYGINVGVHLALIVLIAHTEYSSPLGSVWYYTRRIVTELQQMVGDLIQNTSLPPLNETFKGELEQAMDLLLGEDNAMLLGTANHARRNEQGALNGVQEKQSNVGSSPDALLSLEEAIRRGLVPKEWFAR